MQARSPGRKALNAWSSSSARVGGCYLLAATLFLLSRARYSFSLPLFLSFSHSLYNVWPLGSDKRLAANHYRATYVRSACADCGGHSRVFACVRYDDKQTTAAATTTLRDPVDDGDDDGPSSSANSAKSIAVRSCEYIG